MAKSKVGQEPVIGLNGKPLKFKGNKIIPAEYFDQEPTQEAIDLIESQTPEETYADSLRIGLARDRQLERRLDMSQIPTELLD